MDMIRLVEPEGIVQTRWEPYLNKGNNGRTKTITTPRVGAKAEYTRTAYNSDGTLKTKKVSGGQSFTFIFTWKDSKSTVNMDNICG